MNDPSYRENAAPLRRTFLLAVGAVAIAAFAACLRAAEPRNVLFIGVDDLRPELHCYGVDQMITPQFDALARRGVRFDRAYCNIAVCGASRASLMTGLRPTPTRFTSYRTWKKNDAPDVPSIAMTFRNHGYRTLTHGKIYHHRGDDAEAWSEPDWRPEKRSAWYALEENQKLAAREGKRGPAYEAADAPDSAYPDHSVASETIADLRRLAEGDEPFFLACGFYRPHLPFNVPQKYWDLYPPSAVQLPENMFFPRSLPDAFDYNWGELRNYHAIPRQGPVSDETANKLIHGYYASVSFIDAQIGRLLSELDRLDLADDTIIVLWGDHGWQLGEHGFWCKHTNFEVATRVPLIMVAPGVEAGRVSSRLVEYVDLYPTLCDLAGLEKPGHLHGKSLAPLLADVDAPHKDHVITRHGGGDAVRTDRYRYMEMRSMGGRGELRGVGLFDLQQDPQENHNVAEDPTYADVRKRLKRLLDAARADYGS